MHCLAIRVALSGLLFAFSPMLQAQSASESRKHFGRWAEQAERILSTQAADAEPRATLRELMKDQREALGTLTEPMLTTVQPMQQQFTAAFLVDSVKKHRNDLSPAATEQLLALSEDIADHCHKAYPKPGNPCTNEKFWTLKAAIGVSRAKQADADPAQRLAVLPALLQASLEAKQTQPAELCSSLWFLLRMQLRPETFASGKPEARFFEAHLQTLPALLAPCADAIQAEPRQLAASLVRWADAIEETAAVLQRQDPAGDAAVVRATAQKAGALATR